MSNSGDDARQYNADFERITGVLMFSTAAKLQVGDNRDSALELTAETAHGLLDIRESAERFQELLQALLATEIGQERVDDTLTDLGEELRHIYYHIRDMKMFAYIRDT